MSSFTFYNDQTLNNLNANQLNSTALIVDSLVVNNNSIISGDLAVNGGDLVSSAAAAFNLLVNATLAPPAGAGPAAIALGDAAATTTIAGNLVVNGTITPAGGGLNRVVNFPCLAGGPDPIITAARSGTHFTLGIVGTPLPNTGGININLPTPASGLNYTFTLIAPSIFNDASAACTITSTSDGTAAANISVGSVNVDNATTNVVAGVDVGTFTENTATCGDYFTYVCDGANWIVVAVGDAATSVTLA